MSFYDYKAGAKFAVDDISFYGLIQAAMRRADTANLSKLCRAWPEVWAELQARYNAPGGLLPGEVPNVKEG